MQISFNLPNLPREASRIISNLRCCVSQEFSNAVNRAYVGLDCKDSFKTNQVFAMLEYLQEVTWDNLDYECLERIELEDLANFVNKQCKC